jgi:rfaE bifunctional protein kinase chain/domain
MSGSLHSLFEKMNGLRVLVVGDVMADAYVRGKVERISPEAPVPIIHARKNELRPGGAANVALNLRALGAEVDMVALIGNDSKGTELLQLLDSEGIGTEGIVRSDLRPSTVKTRIIAGGQHLLRIDEENDSPTYPPEKPHLLEKALLLAQKADAILFEDYDKGTLFPELIQELISLAGKRGIPTTVDPKKRNFMEYKGVNLFKPNLKELKDGLRIEPNPRKEEEIQLACRQLAMQLGVKGVLLTLSEYGMALSMDSFFQQIPAQPRDIADVSGAGDTVISVATLCLAAGADMATTLFLANLAGGQVCEYSGVVPVKKDLLLAEALEKLPFHA